jgi:hypothetical protein
MRTFIALTLLGFSCLAADINAPEADGTTPLHRAVRADDLAQVNKLLAAGADARVANRYGVTPLYLACENANPAMIERRASARTQSRPRRDSADGSTHGSHQTARFCWIMARKSMLARNSTT